MAPIQVPFWATSGGPTKASYNAIILAFRLVETKHLIFSEIHEKLPAVTANGKDRHHTERSIKNILRATMSSTYLQRGYWNAACLEAQKLLDSTSTKSSDVISIAVTNLAYGLAAKVRRSFASGGSRTALCLFQGQYDRAKAVLADYRYRFAKFSVEFDRLCLAEGLVGFETAFLSGDDEECKRHLSQIEALSSTEAMFRKAAYDAARDTFGEAIESMLKFLETADGKKPYLKCR